MKIYTILLFSVAALLLIIGILICCGKLKKLKKDTFGESRFVGSSLILVSALLVMLGIVVITDIKSTVFLLVTGSFIISGIFILLRRESIDSNK